MASISSKLLRLSNPTPDESDQRRVRSRSLEFCFKSLGQCAEVADRVARNAEFLKSRSYRHEQVVDPPATFRIARYRNLDAQLRCLKPVFNQAAEQSEFHIGPRSGSAKGFAQQLPTGGSERQVLCLTKKPFHLGSWNTITPPRTRRR